MKFHKLTANIIVSDVNTTTDYYIEKLGFSMVMTIEDFGIYKWSLVKRDNVEVLFQQKDDLLKQYPAFTDFTEGSALSLFFQIENIEGFYEEVKDKVKTVKDIYKTFNGLQQFVIQDCNGHLLIFAENKEYF